MRRTLTSLRLLAGRGGVARCAPLGCQRAERSRRRRPTPTQVADDSQRAAAAKAAAATAAAAAPVGTGWATLKGTFTFDGDPPAMPPYAVNKDQAACAPGGTGAAAGVAGRRPGDQGHRQHRHLSPATCRACTSRPSRATEPLVFDQKECVFLTHVVGVHGRPAGAHQEQRRRWATTRRSTARTSSTRRFPPAAPCRGRRKREEATPVRGPLQHPPVDDGVHAAAQERATSR